MPYVACIIGALGMMIHFGIKLTEFIRKKSKSRAAAEAMLADTPPPKKNGKNARPDQYVLLPRPIWTRANFLVPAAAVIVMIIYGIGMIIANTPPTEPYDLAAFGKLPISFEVAHSPSTASPATLCGS